jgi:hypothetical protein
MLLVAMLSVLLDGVAIDGDLLASPDQSCAQAQEASGDGGSSSLDGPALYAILHVPSAPRVVGAWQPGPWVAEGVPAPIGSLELAPKTSPPA